MVPPSSIVFSLSSYKWVAVDPRLQTEVPHAAITGWCITKRMWRTLRGSSTKWLSGKAAAVVLTGKFMLCIRVDECEPGAAGVSTTASAAVNVDAFVQVCMHPVGCPAPDLYMTGVVFVL